jgi:signal transduction histidine kinase
MEEILVLSRLDAGKMECKPAKLDWEAFCYRIVDEVLSATDNRCSIELSLEDLPAQAEADDRLLGHIFTNLLGNAIKYSDLGATVRFHVRRDGVRAICCIEDHGIGIPVSDIPWLFTAFHRGGNVGDRPGTGLGLVLVKRCVDLHAGTIHVDSQTGQGTTVTVSLPVFSPNENDPHH